MTRPKENDERVTPPETEAMEESMENDELRELPVEGAAAEPHQIGRRTVLGMSLATVVELMLARVFPQPALAQTPPGNAPASRQPPVRQLPPAGALAYVNQQLAKNTTAQGFKKEFEKQKYTFILERAKVFVVGDQTLAILPSLVPVKRSDPSHKAVSIAISTAGTVAAGATISHSPTFQVVDFTLYYFTSGGKLESRTIDTKTLEAKPVEQIVRELGKLPVDSARIGFNGRPKPATKQGIDQIIDLFYRQTIADKWVKPLYPEEGVRSMLAQIPVIQKFSEVNGLVYTNLLRAGGPIVLCTSTSSNICTSSSIIINLQA